MIIDGLIFSKNEAGLCVEIGIDKNKTKITNADLIQAFYMLNTSIRSEWFEYRTLLSEKYLMFMAQFGVLSNHVLNSKEDEELKKKYEMLMNEFLKKHENCLKNNQSVDYYFFLASSFLALKANEPLMIKLLSELNNLDCYDDKKQLMAKNNLTTSKALQYLISCIAQYFFTTEELSLVETALIDEQCDNLTKAYGKFIEKVTNA